MESMLQTKANDTNYQDFYKSVYPMQTNSVGQLIDLSSYTNTTCVLIDCCGWHYKKLFPTNRIISIEHVQTAKQFKLSAEQFDKLVDDQYRWPRLPVQDPVVVLDRSPMLKYHTLDDISNMLHNLASSYTPGKLILRANMLFIDDNRLEDRFYNLSSIALAGYVVEKFCYDVKKLILEVEFNAKTSNG
jgi:hypothetical protein